MNKKMLLMILFSFLSHVTLAGVIIYTPLYVATNNSTKNYSINQNYKVIWGSLAGKAGPYGGSTSGGFIANKSGKSGANFVARTQSRKSSTAVSSSVGLTCTDRINTACDQNMPKDAKRINTDSDTPIQEEVLEPSQVDDTKDVTPIFMIGREAEGSADPSTSSGQALYGRPMSVVGSSGLSTMALNINGDNGCNSTIYCGSGGGSGSGLQDGGNSNGYNIGSILEHVKHEIENHKYYPDIARINGIEGTVYINFYIGQNGIPKSISIARSSGSNILDESGIRTIRRIKKISSVPEELRELYITVPITYRLE